MAEKIDLTDAWLEWHETCALDLCSEENINKLCNISNMQYKRALQKLEAGQLCIENFAVGRKTDNRLARKPGALPTEEENPAAQDEDKYAKRRNFYLIETELLPAGDVQERQAYKERIFSKAGEPGKVTGYFFKSFYRSFVKRKENLALNSDNFSNAPKEHENERENAINKLTANDDTPDVRADSELYRTKTKEFWNRLNEAEKTALYVFNSNIPICAAQLLEKVGVKKEAFRNYPKRLLTELAVMGQNELELSISKDFKPLLATLQDCYREWEQTSEIGKWLVANTKIPETSGMKTRFK